MENQYTKTTSNHLDPRDLVLLTLILYRLRIVRQGNKKLNVLSYSAHSFGTELKTDYRAIQRSLKVLEENGFIEISAKTLIILPNSLTVSVPDTFFEQVTTGKLTVLEAGYLLSLRNIVNPKTMQFLGPLERAMYLSNVTQLKQFHSLKDKGYIIIVPKVSITLTSDKLDWFLDGFREEVKLKFNGLTSLINEVRQEVLTEVQNIKLKNNLI